MPSSNGHTFTDPETPANVDTAHLFGDAQRSFNWRDKIAEQRAKNANSLWNKITHKSANIPLDGEAEDMNITTTTDNRRTGLGWKELAIIAAAMLGIGGSSAFVATQIANRQPDSTQPSPEPILPPKYTLDIEGR